MTREEIIEQLNLAIGLIKQDGKDWLDDRDVPMLEECVKALSQEPICPSAGVDCEDCPADDAISRILKRMWNCRGKHTTSIDKVAMEQIIRDELSSVTSKPIECDDTVSRGVFDQVRWERDIAIEQLHELGYELGQKIEPCDAISRDAVMGLVAREHTEWDDLYIDIAKLPSVTQKSGKWMEHPEIETTTPEYLMFYECSECGYKPCFCKSDIHKKRFCSNCGAKMESEE